MIFSKSNHIVIYQTRVSVCAKRNNRFLPF